MNNPELEELVSSIEALNTEIQNAKLDGDIDSQSMSVLNDLQFQATLTTTRLNWIIKQSKLKSGPVATS